MNQNIQRKYERVNSLIFPGCLFQSIIFQLLSRTVEDEPGRQLVVVSCFSSILKVLAACFVMFFFRWLRLSCENVNIHVHANSASFEICISQPSVLFFFPFEKCTRIIFYHCSRICNIFRCLIFTSLSNHSFVQIENSIHI
jgi:hypothetical protein